MLNRIFPKQFDNVYRGHWLALVLLAILLVVRLLIAARSMAFAHDTALTADGIPLESFGASAAAAVVQMFSLLGLHIFVQSLIGVVVLIRYRAMAPFFYLVLLFQQLGVKILHFVYPEMPSAASTAAPGAIVSLSILAVTVVGLALSLVDRSANRIRAEA